MKALSSFLLLTVLCANLFAEENMTKTSELPIVVKEFLLAVKNQDSKLFESLLSENVTVDDWGKIINGKQDTLKFSESHLIGAKGDYEITEIKNEDGNVLLDGTWKSQSFTGPTRFIFEIKEEKIQKLVISSPRLIDRLFIGIKSIF